MKTGIKARRVGLAIASVGVVVAVGMMGAAGQPESKSPGAATPAGRANGAAAECLAKLAFLKGTWAGPMHGDPVEETWSGASGDSMMGMFRWVSEGKTTMYEVMSIRDEGGTAVLRLRHFGADFVPWKGECDGVAALHATETGERVVVFTNDSGVGGLAACRYECPGADVLKVKVSFKDEKREALEFELKRQ